ncbi:AAEL002316-PA [Aedes aegypti]|uniref:AAEL002316-PA n=2 Tax=Aedes aegypti TaxID=7159 RepID=A0A1S4F1E4_AEDAE|nr:gastrula zinc finger protein XlCGF7.1 [Aedes aegypti]EAT46515.1 AAEL002316-PA [Aedes aegypti]
MSGEVLEEEISEISIDNIGVNEEIETCESQEPQEQTSKSEKQIADGCPATLINELDKQSIKSAKTFDCSHCPKSFNEMRKFQRHKESHNQERHKCEQCGKFLKTRSSLNSHRQRHQHGKRFECEVCRKRFATVKDLKTHQKVHEEQTERFPCDECGKDFGRIYSLLDHKRLHSGKEIFSCDKCDKIFPKRRNLLLHERSHLVEEQQSK